MNRGLMFLGGAGLGAGLMYLLDPYRGAHRRSQIRDQWVHAIHVAGDAADATSEDARNRARGLFAGAKSRLKGETVSEDVLVARVRAKMGRVVSHPRAIEVTARQGRITLRGSVLADEMEGLLNAVHAVPGVLGVDNHLVAHAGAGDIPSLQGGRPRPDQTGNRRKSWSPTARLLAGATGGALALYGRRRGGLVGTTLGTAGLGILYRGLTCARTAAETHPSRTVRGVAGAPADATETRESGQPGGGQGRRDEVGGSGVYPASGPWPEGDAPLQPMASWGQGERGAAGYEDHGDSELHIEGALGGEDEESVTGTVVADTSAGSANR